MTEVFFQVEGADVPFDRDGIGRFADFILKRLDAEGKSVSIVFIDSSYMRRLNAEYRGKDAPTDVLSFSLSWGGAPDGATEESGFPESEALGEIYVSMDQVRENAAGAGERLEVETLRVIAHGMLHLLGHDHDEGADLGEVMSRLSDPNDIDDPSLSPTERMYSLQEKILRDYVRGEKLGV